MTSILRNAFLAVAIVGTLSSCIHGRGRGPTAGPTVVRSGGDHDRGHGNDADGHDDDNPGHGRGRGRGHD